MIQYPNTGVLCVLGEACIPVLCVSKLKQFQSNSFNMSLSHNITGHGLIIFQSSLHLYAGRGGGEVYA